MTIEEQAEAYINKHKKLQLEKDRIEMKLEIKREQLKEERLKLKELGFDTIKEAREALRELEKDLRERISELDD